MLYKAINSIFCVRILNIMCLAAGDVSPELAATPLPFRFEVLGEAALRQYARIPGNNLDPEFVSRAYRRGDRCYGFLDGENLASFLWYAAGPGELGPGLLVDFPRQYTYVYHGYTCPGYRGQKLFRLAFDQALRDHAARGSRGLLCYVEGNNFTSQCAMRRTGFRRVGRVFLCRFFGRYLIYHDRGCRRFHLRVRESFPDAPGAPADQ